MNEIRQIEFNEKDFLQSFDEMEKQIEILKQDESYEAVYQAINKINEIRDHYLTMYWISYILYSKDVTDKKYLDSETLIGKLDPKMENLRLSYFKALSKSKYREELIKVIGSRPFELADNESVLLNNSIAELKQKERTLITELMNHTIKRKIEFKGKLVSRNQLKVYYRDDDRMVRKEAFDASYKIGLEIADKVEKILDNLIKLRTEIANTLGFKSYTEVGLIQMNRIGYNQDDINNLTKQVKTYLVPLAKILSEKQRQRLDLEKLEYFDGDYLFKDGEAKIKGDINDIVKTTIDIINRYLPESAELYKKLYKEGLIDLGNGENQAPYGITTYLPDFKTPLFLSAYRGLSTNIGTMQHEFGHAQQLYYSKDLKFHENRWPTFDICEIHSTSMEFLMYPHLKEYFEDNNYKANIRCLTEKISYLINMTLQNELQEYLYDNPSATKQERREKWLSLNAEYGKITEGHEYLENGASIQAYTSGWDRPFYFIDYTIATICALSFFKKVKENDKEAWTDFYTLCKLGGSKSLPELIKCAKLDNPFEKDSLKNLTVVIKNEIENLK